MKQIRIDAFGPPSQVVRCCEVAAPGAPAAWEVLVDIDACAVNLADLARIAGHYGELPKLPATPGLEAVGRIVECGASVSELAPGDQVILMANDNWCQRRRLPASLVFKVGAPLDPLQLAGLKVGACSALELVRRQAALAPGGWLVQTAPLSAVGRAVMQIARQDGLRTLNIVRRPEAIAEVLAAGGDVALEDGPELVRAARAAAGSAPLTVAFDAVGGDGVARLAALLDSGGTIVNYGMLSGRPIQLDCDDAIFRGIGVKGFWLTRRLARMTHAQRDALLAEAVELVRAGVLRSEVAATYPLDAIGKALREAAQPVRPGKVYLLPNGEPGAIGAGGSAR
ncbi:zinc-dependent alcohol dehydrogenase family protein [Paraburkholderia sp. MMS20-SJTR3]|uniref:enoyl-[acyl-carrier-protein] reductase n=1 Tax=Paraburkholderia sejongensis TaxID=2886946 RepID=A0ABS8JX28_9BURK|nr:zinc-dependent alcohol dehydrogenase family protein [Paraburkholderia sp. MMS20-SJTR3]MCC8394467.1 zinc-dependent alcohol dehydrogenase family protein [Paraburkholderia sp. MMS20-SJTR3]